ncbi:MAG: hypothetical protein ACSLEZ_15090 [Thiobacillus sp.]
MTDDLNKQRKAHHEDRNRLVRVKHMLYKHATDNAVLLIESEDLAGDAPRSIWIPRKQVSNWSRPIAGCYPYAPLEFDCPKWLAEEKELFYE